jgi:hypothetical protein
MLITPLNGSVIVTGTSGSASPDILARARGAGIHQSG